MLSTLSITLGVADERYAHIQSREIVPETPFPTADATVATTDSPGSAADGQEGEAAQAGPLAILEPAEGAVLDNGTGGDPIVWLFRWSEVPEATRYHLRVIGARVPNPIIDEDELRGTSYRLDRAGSISGPNLRGWQARVRAMVDGEWTAWSAVRRFDVVPVGSPQPTDPEPRATQDGPGPQSAQRPAADAEGQLAIERQSVAQGREQLELLRREIALLRLQLDRERAQAVQTRDQLEQQCAVLEAQLAEARAELERALAAPQQQAGELVIRVYPVGALASEPRPMGPFGTQGGPYDELIEAIVRTVAPDSWDAVGGPGSIVAFGSGGVLVVRQTEEVHHEIEALLQVLEEHVERQRVEEPEAALEGPSL